MSELDELDDEFVRTERDLFVFRPVKSAVKHAGKLCSVKAKQANYLKQQQRNWEKQNDNN